MGRKLQIYTQDKKIISNVKIQKYYIIKVINTGRPKRNQKLPCDVDNNKLSVYRIKYRFVHSEFLM